MKAVPVFAANRWWMPTPLRWRRLGYPAMLLAELARALEAGQRYHALRHGGADGRLRDGLSTADISRRIFEEFYAGGEPLCRS